MYANAGFPHNLHWDSVQLADAVPRRLSELYRFDIQAHDVDSASANGEPRRAIARGARPYLPASTLPGLFRVD
jgi:hypothetical protein